MLMMLLDEIMAHAAGNTGHKVVTASVTVRFRAPVRLGVELTVRGQVVSRRGKILKVEGFLESATGQVLTSAEGSFVILGPVEPGRFGNPGDAETV
jgi:acyl-coenzyme A thioesterase PaaI-like protein